MKKKKIKNNRKRQNKRIKTKVEIGVMESKYMRGSMKQEEY